MFEVVQQRGRGDFGVRREEDGGASDFDRGGFFQHPHQAVECDRAVARFALHMGRAFDPGPHHHAEEGCEDDRDIAAIDHLGEVRGEEEAFQHDQRHHHGKRQDERPFPGLVEQEDREDRGDDHVARYRDAIGAGEVRG